MSLPTVQQGVTDAVMAQYSMDRQYNENLWTRMATENPEVFLYATQISNVIARDYGMAAGAGTLNALGILYRVLENQDDADRLTEEIG